MTPALLLAWAEVGAKLITVLGVPVATIIKLFKGAGGTDEEALQLIGQWAGLVADVKARIAFLEAAIAALNGSDR